MLLPEVFTEGGDGVWQGGPVRNLGSDVFTYIRLMAQMKSQHPCNQFKREAEDATERPPGQGFYLWSLTLPWEHVDWKEDSVHPLLRGELDPAT